MDNRRLHPAILVALTVLSALAAPAFARGDKVIPQVADGPGIVTKFDIVNVSDYQPITKYKLRFFHQDGSAWTLATTLGTGSEFILNFSARQTLRVETLGRSSTTTAGYAVFRDDETLNSQYSKDYVLGITAYYATTSGTSITGVVSVPPAEAAQFFSLPVEMNNSKNLFTGLAIVNRAEVSTEVALTLFAATDPVTGPVGTAQTITLTLKPGEQRAEFLHQILYPGLLNFKGLLEGIASGPVSVLGLVQIGTATGPQYASISPTLRDYLRQNTNMMMIQAYLGEDKKFYPIDLDNIRVDYFQQDDGDEGLPWDIKYETVARGKRQLTPVNGAGIIALGVMDPDPFDSYQLANLRTLQYSTSTPIDLSDLSPSLVVGASFAIHTNLGNYVKIRISRVVDTTTGDGNTYKDLGLDICVYR